MVVDIISKHATIKLVGKDCEVADFRKLAQLSLKETKNWPFQISKCRRILFSKRNGRVLTRGELAYRSDVGNSVSILRVGVNLRTVNPDVVEKQNSVSNLKKEDVEKLLKSHFGENWRENEDLKFYLHVIDGAQDANGNVEENNVCELNPENEILSI